MADLVADSYILGMEFFHMCGGRVDLKACQFEVFHQAYQMTYEGKSIEPQPVDLGYDIMVPARSELVALATMNPQPGRDDVMISTISSWGGFSWKFADCGLVVVHSVIDAHSGKFLINIVNLGEQAICLQRGQRVATLQGITCIGPPPETLSGECDSDAHSMHMDGSPAEHASKKKLEANFSEHLQNLVKSSGPLDLTGKHALVQLIADNADMFASADGRVWCISWVHHEINTGDQWLIKQPPR